MRPIRWARRGVALLGLGAAGGAVVLVVRHALLTPQPLESGLVGEARIDREHGGEIYYTVAGTEQRSPIVLLHDFYPGASSYEFRSLFRRLAHAHQVYAPDWLGFGMSERPPLAFTGELYASMLAGFLRDVVARPAVVVAAGRAANIAARAAADAPELFERIVLVSPYVEAGWQLDPTPAQMLVRLAERIGLAAVPQALVSSRPALGWTARRRGLGAATEDTLDHEWAAAHQLGARHAVLATLTGELDLPLQNVLPLLEPPVLIVAGEEDRRHTRDEMEELAVLNPYTDLDVIPGAGAAVYQEQPERFVTVLNLWLRRELPRHGPTETLRIGHPDPISTAAAQAQVTDGEPHQVADTGGADEPIANAGSADQATTRQRTGERKPATHHQQAAAESSREDPPAGATSGRGSAGASTQGQASKGSRPTKAARGDGESALRHAPTPARPRAATSNSRQVAETDATTHGANGSRRATGKRAAAERDRTRGQSQPSNRRDAPADKPESERE